MTTPTSGEDPIAFTPDGRRLLVAVDRSDYAYLDPAGRLLGEMTLPFVPSGFSPSGGSIIGIGRPASDPALTTVYVARADGTGVRALTVVKNAVVSVSWSSRGKIALGIVPYVDGIPRHGLIELISDRGRVLRMFKPPLTGCRWIEPGDLDWSPNGRELAFGAGAAGYQTGVFMLNVRTRRAWRLPLKLRMRQRRPGGQYLTSGQPFFSPNGRWLLIFAGDPGLFRVRTDGSHPILLSDQSSIPPNPGYAGVLENVAWQPVPKRYESPSIANRPS